MTTAKEAGVTYELAGFTCSDVLLTMKLDSSTASKLGIVMPAPVIEFKAAMVDGSSCTSVLTVSVGPVPASARNIPYCFKAVRTVCAAGLKVLML